MAKNNRIIAAISLDYEKNLPIPVTKVSSKYYMRQLWLHNFCIHNMVNGKAEMFVYSEHFAGKGANEVISLSNFYINRLSSQIETLYIFCDNCFAKNKNRYIWTFYESNQE